MKRPIRFAPALIALTLASAAASGTARAAEIRDGGGMFSASAIRQAQATLGSFERSTGLPVQIETVRSLKEATTPREKSEWSRRSAREVVTLLAERKDREAGGRALYILLARDDKVISNPLVPAKFAGTLTEARRSAIREAFVNGMRTGDPDRALRDASLVIERSGAEMARAGGGANAGNAPFLPGPNPRPANANAPAQVPGTNPRMPAPGAPQPVPGPGFPGTFGLIILIGGAWLFFRMIRGLLGMGRPSAPHAGYGPENNLGGPNQPGYGPVPPRGGGIFSSILGGLGGAIAGNWVYDQFRGHSSGQAHAGQSPFFPTSDPGAAAQDPGGIVGGDDQRGLGGSWGSGSDTPGGWLDGGSSGGGDWGGGGGDWGGGDGGGGDW
jgi:uncharacterized protein